MINEELSSELIEAPQPLLSVNEAEEKDERPLY